MYIMYRYIYRDTKKIYKETNLRSSQLDVIFDIGYFAFPSFMNKFSSCKKIRFES